MVDIDRRELIQKQEENILKIGEIVSEYSQEINHLHEVSLKFDEQSSLLRNLFFDFQKAIVDIPDSSGKFQELWQKVESNFERTHIIQGEMGQQISNTKSKLDEIINSHQSLLLNTQKSTEIIQEIQTNNHSNFQKLWKTNEQNYLILNAFQEKTDKQIKTGLTTIDNINKNLSLQSEKNNIIFQKIIDENSNRYDSLWEKSLKFVPAIYSKLKKNEKQDSEIYTLIKKIEIILYFVIGLLIMNFIFVLIR
ncbi:MAG: hypothetical protein GXY48_09525 [Methanomicrobiales archaeon]|nr:hypothetical protein [Methanomicrobiales archaeon]